MTTAPERELESLLRGEIAAAETYKQALAKVDAAEAGPLRDIQRQHGEAIKFFYQQLTAHGCEAPTHSGVWGFFARAVEGGASLLGDRAALSALRTGEQQGLEQYAEGAAIWPAAEQLPHLHRKWADPRATAAHRCADPVDDRAVKPQQGLHCRACRRRRSSSA